MEPVKIFEHTIQRVDLVSSNKRLGYNHKTKRAFPAKEYAECKNYLTLVFRAAYRGEPRPKDEYYRIDYIIHTYKDLTNCLKIIEDGLKAAGVINDDRNVMTTSAVKTPAKRGEPDRLKVIVYACPSR